MYALIHAVEIAQRHEAEDLMREARRRRAAARPTPVPRGRRRRTRRHRTQAAPR